jgi:hypothetical protein
VESTVPIEIQQGYVGTNKLKVARSFERQMQGKFCELNNISTANAISNTNKILKKPMLLFFTEKDSNFPKFHRK